MRNNFADPAAEPQFSTAAQASGTEAVITIPANADQFWCLDWISWSYGGTPTNGNLQVSIGGVVVWQIDITVGGPGHIYFKPGLYGRKNQAVVVTLANGGVANKVNVRYR